MGCSNDDGPAAELLDLAQRLATLTPEQRAEAIARMAPPAQHAIMAAIMAQPLLKATIGATAKLTAKQIEADALLDGPCRHILLVGGSRSGNVGHCPQARPACADGAVPAGDPAVQVQRAARLHHWRHVAGGDGGPLSRR